MAKSKIEKSSAKAVAAEAAGEPAAGGKVKIIDRAVEQLEALNLIVPLDQLEVHPLCAEFAADEEDGNNITSDVIDRGLIQPLTVYPKDGDDGGWWIINGQHRYEGLLIRHSANRSAPVRCTRFLDMSVPVNKAVFASGFMRMKMTKSSWIYGYFTCSPDELDEPTVKLARALSCSKADIVGMRVLEGKQEITYTFQAGEDGERERKTMGKCLRAVRDSVRSDGISLRSVEAAVLGFMTVEFNNGMRPPTDHTKTMATGMTSPENGFANWDKISHKDQEQIVASFNTTFNVFPKKARYKVAKKLSQDWIDSICEARGLVPKNKTK